MKRLLACLGAALILLAGCGKGPVTIGFVGGLTGKMSDLGISGRNSLMLAVQEVNNAGGINGTPIEVIVKDDKNDPATAKQVVNELIDEGADVIIGHMVSTMSIETVPIINEHKIPMISPTTSTPALSKKDDYFLRIIPENTSRITRKVEYITSNYSIDSIAAIIDLSNDAYALSWWENFKTAYLRETDGRVLDVVRFTSGEDNNYLSLINDIAEEGPEGIVLVANAFDTAMFCQQIEKNNIDSMVIPCGWANTHDLIKYGGNAVEGLFFVTAVEPGQRKPEFSEFSARYAEAYNAVPDFAAVNTYDAVRVIKEAYEEKGKKETLKDAVIRIGTFRGLQRPVVIDKFGDASRDYHILIVRNGEFVQLE